jgi:hypothetical protein
MLELSFYMAKIFLLHTKNKFTYQFIQHFKHLLAQ